MNEDDDVMMMAITTTTAAATQFILMAYICGLSLFLSFFSFLSLHILVIVPTFLHIVCFYFNTCLSVYRSSLRQSPLLSTMENKNVRNL